VLKHILAFTPQLGRNEGSAFIIRCNSVRMLSNHWATATVNGTFCGFDALVRSAPKSRSSPPKYVPVLFVRTDKVLTRHKLILAFSALTLAHLQGEKPALGKIVRGSHYATLTVQLAKLLNAAKRTLHNIMDIRDGAAPPPPLRLNNHCSVCKFKEQCHAAAVAKDDLSLLRGLKEKELIS